jgi:hypothetical protein
MSEGAIVSCPACGAAVDEEAFCSWCGLDLNGVSATTLRQLITHIGDIDERTMELTAQRQTLVTQLTQLRWSIIPETAPPAPSAHQAPSQPGAPEWTIDRVRSVLLWVGAALLAASALTFTAVAWSHLGESGRAALLGAVTGVFTGLALSLRRRLPASAEAFTALATGLVLIDWHAMHRAGLGAAISGSTWWAFGSLVAAAFAFVLGHAVGTRTSRVAIAILLPLSAELLVPAVAGAAWAVALALAMISAAVVVARRYVVSEAEPAIQRVLALHALVAWAPAAGFAAGAATTAHTFAQSLCPAAVVSTLAFAPAAALHRRLSRNAAEVLAGIVVAVLLGALVTVAATSFGPQGLVAWATFVSCVATVVVLQFAPARWQKPAYVAAAAYAWPGVAFASVVGLVAAFGPLAWFRDAWTGSLDVVARNAYVGARTRHPFDAYWPAVWVFGVATVALGFVAAKTRRGVGGAVALAILGIGLAPVVAGASARVTLITAVAVVCVVLIGAAALDRSSPRLSVGVLPTVLFAVVPAAGWAAVTRDASIAVLLVVAVAAALAAVVAVSDVVRVAGGVGAGALTIALAGVWTAAFDVGPAPSGFAVVAAAGIVILFGTHVRARAADGDALQLTGAMACSVGLILASSSSAWVAGALTALVPLMVGAALRRDRAALYRWAAAGAALAATWAWLAAAHVAVVEAYTGPAALLALVAGLVGWRAGPARSWLTIGPALVIALGPTLAIGIANDEVARTVASAVIAFAVVLFGAWKRLQAPLAIGATALLVLAIDTFGPAAARLPEWVPLATIGVLLMWIGATFERRREDARRATDQLLRFG